MLDELAEKYHVTNSAIAIAWILRHPAGIQAIVGSTKKQRLSLIHIYDVVNVSIGY